MEEAEKSDYLDLSSTSFTGIPSIIIQGSIVTAVFSKNNQVWVHTDTDTRTIQEILQFHIGHKCISLYDDKVPISGFNLFKLLNSCGLCMGNDQIIRKPSETRCKILDAIGEQELFRIEKELGHPIWYSDYEEELKCCSDSLDAAAKTFAEDHNM